MFPKKQSKRELRWPKRSFRVGEKAGPDICMAPNCQIRVCVYTYVYKYMCIPLLLLFAFLTGLLPLLGIETLTQYFCLHKGRRASREMTLID